VAVKVVALYLEQSLQMVAVVELDIMTPQVTLVMVLVVVAVVLMNQLELLQAAVLLEVTAETVLLLQVLAEAEAELVAPVALVVVQTAVLVAQELHHPLQEQVFFMVQVVGVLTKVVLQLLVLLEDPA
jgi:hypothetical protein